MARKEQSRTLRVCKVCGREFMGFSTAKMCSPACKREDARTRDAIKRIKAREQQESSKKNMSELARLNEEARAAGMSYGQYVAMKYVEKERVKRKGATSGKAR